MISFYQKRFWMVFLIGALAMISGCVSIEDTATPIQSLPKKGIYHKVSPGETLWRIAKRYDVSIDQIVKSNNIPDAAYIEKGQLIFIPNAESSKEVLPSEATGDSNDFAWPVKGKVVSYFGQPTKSGVNRGVDIQTSPGNTVYAARDGKVIFADDLSSYDKTVIIDHQDGYYTVYAQNSSLLVKVDDAVKKGTALAQMGNRSKLASLHFEVRKNGMADNPLYYLP